MKITNEVINDIRNRTADSYKEKDVEKGCNVQETGLRRRYGAQSGNANGKTKRSLDDMTSVLSKKIEPKILKEDNDKDIGR